MCAEESDQKVSDHPPSYGLTCQMIVESFVAVQAQLGQTLTITKGFSTLQAMEQLSSRSTMQHLMLGCEVNIVTSCHRKLG